MSWIDQTDPVAGIDVGGLGKGFHVVLLDRSGAVAGLLSSTDPRIVATWCLAKGAKLVAVDAPCAWSLDGRSRPAEVELKNACIQCFSTPTREAALAHAGDHFGWILNGERLFQALASKYPLIAGPTVSVPGSIETFPQAVACALAGTVVSAKRKSVERRALLQRLGLDVGLLSNIDFVDAAMCAVAARFALLGDARTYGEPSTGLIWVPGSQANATLGFGTHSGTVAAAGIAPAQSQPIHPVSRPTMITQPPCSFCGRSDESVHVGFRAMICNQCIVQLRAKLAELSSELEAAAVHHFVPGQECVLCERILSTARFSVRRWIFGICDTCACSVTDQVVDYRGVPAQSFDF